MLPFILLKIFFARILDVSLGTFRTILTVRGKTYIPTVIAFFEVIIWYYVAKEALLVKIDSYLIPISYALGYSAGNFIGILISKRFINKSYELKILNYNKKQLNYIKNNHLDMYQISGKNLVIFLTKKDFKNIIKRLHILNEKSIIYINEISTNNNLQSKNNML